MNSIEPTLTTLAVTSSDLKTAVLVVIVAAYIIFRLMQRHQVSRGFLIAVPVILLFFGVDELHEIYDELAVALFAACLVVEFGVGLALGRTYRMWREEDGAVWSQGTRWTIVLWLVAVGIRVLFIGAAQALGAEVTESAEILISLAVTFAGQNLVVASRAGFFTVERAEPPPSAERL